MEEKNTKKLTLIGDQATTVPAKMNALCSDQ